MTLGMKVAGAAALAAVTGGVFTVATIDDQDPVTLTGCLRQGSAATVFVLRGASVPAEEQPNVVPQARDYLVVAVPDGTDLKGLLNHRVAMTGAVASGEGAPAPPSEANAVERALRRMSASSVQDVAPNCGAP